MDWNELPQETRDWMEFIGDFRPTSRMDSRQLFGFFGDDWGCDNDQVIDANQLRELAAACIEVADWLDRRAEHSQFDIDAKML